MVAVNRAFLRRVGLPEEKVLGRTSEELGLWKDPEVRRRIVDRLRQDGVVRDLEIEGSPPDGSRLVLAFTARVVDVGGVPHMLSISRDITAAKLAEERLQLEKERLAVTLQSIGDAVIAADESSRITVLNAVAESLTGWSAAEALGRPLDEVFPIANEETRRPLPDPVAPSALVERVHAVLDKP